MMIPAVLTPASPIVQNPDWVRVPAIQEEERRHVQRLHLRGQVGQGLKW